MGVQGFAESDRSTAGARDQNFCSSSKEQPEAEEEAAPTCAENVTQDVAHCLEQGGAVRSAKDGGNDVTVAHGSSTSQPQDGLSLAEEEFELQIHSNFQRRCNSQSHKCDLCTMHRTVIANDHQFILEGGLRAGTVGIK